MYEQAQTVRTPVTGSDRKQNSGPSSQVPPNREGSTSESVDHGNPSGMHGYGQETSSNVYQEAEPVKLENLSGDLPHVTESSTDTAKPEPDGAVCSRVCCRVAVLAVVVTAVTVMMGIVLLMFVNVGTNRNEQTIPYLATTVGILALKQNQTAVMEQGLVQKRNMTAVQCPLLSRPINGFVSGSNSYGDVVKFTCDPGFILVGASSLTCLSDGTWNEKSPTCMAVQCPFLSHPINGFVSGSNFYGDMSNFTCDPGYNLIGASSLTCLSDGTWSVRPPICVGPKKWRDDGRCGQGYPAEDGNPSECDPYGASPCCSPVNWCGNTADHCNCPTCVNYNKADCHFPFVYKKKTYHSCTKVDWDKEWCATTAVYKYDHQWKNCK
uniref:Sushi domain-containing protein n=1 Tax=Branchiostoma floridae TaxID=7739 RepID=C3ZY60_BRAFL|eukprot:XP_002586531.1 hypothetical protein BRAFLDRAFT_106430 [Branchiostoma floridae]